MTPQSLIADQRVPHAEAEIEAIPDTTVNVHLNLISFALWQL